MYDLLLKGGRVLDPSSGRDGRFDVAFRDGATATVAEAIPAEQAHAVQDASGLIVTPGLIDLHTHVYWGGVSLGIDAEEYARSAGVTTLVDAGSAGAGNFHGFRRHVVEAVTPRILAYLNISFPGIYAFADKVMVGECGDFRLLHPGECARVAQEHGDLIVGVKVRVGMAASDGRGVAPLDLALEAAEAAGLPVMCHLDQPPPTRREVVERLRPGDVLTHCFRPFPGAPAHADGTVREEILAARERGILFDVGHGKSSFGFATAEAMLAAGFEPDCISSDVHALSVAGPARDLLTTMSKLLHLGMSLEAVVAATTSGPAAAIRYPELGTLTPGTPGDATLLRLEDGAFDFVDASGDVRTATQRLALAGMVVNGNHWPAPAADAG